MRFAEFLCGSMATLTHLALPFNVGLDATAIRHIFGAPSSARRYHAARGTMPWRDTMPRGISCRAGYHALAGYHREILSAAASSMQSNARC